MPGNEKDKDCIDSDARQDARQAARDHRQQAIYQAVTAALSKHTAEMEARFTAMLKASTASSMLVSIKTSSGASQISAMSPFDWIRDKHIYQQWKSWSQWAQHAADAMEGDTEEAKVHYFYHWIGEGADKIDSWKRNDILFKQDGFDKRKDEEKKGKYSQDKLESYFTLIENLLAPRSNLLLVVEEQYVLKQNSMTAGDFHALISKTAQRCNFPSKEAQERAIRDILYRGMNSQ